MARGERAVDALPAVRRLAQDEEVIDLEAVAELGAVRIDREDELVAAREGAPENPEVTPLRRRTEAGLGRAHRGERILRRDLLDAKANGHAGRVAAQRRADAV